MTNLFKNVPEDEDTAIISAIPAKMDKHDVLIQDWLWDGIYGQSLIFLEKQVGNISDEDLIKQIRKHIEIEGSHTISRKSEGFFFINHKFSIAS